MRNKTRGRVRDSERQARVVMSTANQAFPIKQINITKGLCFLFEATPAHKQMGIPNPRQIFSQAQHPFYAEAIYAARVANPSGPRPNPSLFHSLSSCFAQDQYFSGMAACVCIIASTITAAAWALSPCASKLSLNMPAVTLIHSSFLLFCA
jgi:hypothetical protein